MVIEEAAYVPGKQGAICLNLHLGIEMVFLHHMHQSSNQGKTEQRLTAGKLEEESLS